MKLAFENPPPNSTKDDLAVALAWFCEHQIPLPASWALAVARTDRRFADHGSTASESDQSASLFKTRYVERFGAGMQVEPSSIDRQIRYQPINASLHDHHEFPAPRPGPSGSMTCSTTSASSLLWLTCSRRPRAPFRRLRP